MRRINAFIPLNYKYHKNTHQLMNPCNLSKAFHIHKYSAKSCSYAKALDYYYYYYFKYLHNYMGI